MGKSIRSNFKKAIRAQRRDQVKQEKVFVEAQQRRDEALAKCMAAEVADLPVPMPVLPSMEIDSDATASKTKQKRHHKFLLPTPKPTVNEDEEMADGSAAVPGRRNRRGTPKWRRKETLKVIAGGSKKTSGVPKYGMASMLKRKPRFSKTSKSS